MKEKIINLGVNMIKILLGLIFVVFTIWSFVSTVDIDITVNGYREYPVVSFDNLLLNMFGFVLIGALIWFLTSSKIFRMLPRTAYHSAMLIVTLGGGILYIWNCHNIPRADQAKVYEIAIRFVNGDYDAILESYLKTYPHQLGIIAIFEWIYRILPKDTAKVIMIMNVFFTMGILEILYQIAGKIFSERAQKIYALVAIFSVNIILSCPLVYGTTMGLFFSAAGFYLLIIFWDKKRLWTVILAAICFSLAMIAKENYKIAGIAALIYCVGKWIQQINVRECAWKGAVCLGVVFLSFGGNQLLKERYEMISGYEVSEGTPSLAYVVMGGQEGPQGMGWHNAYDADLYKNYGNDPERMEEKVRSDLLALFQSYVEHPLYHLRFYFMKTLHQWNEPTFQSIWNSSRAGEYDGELPHVVQSLYTGRLNVLVKQWLNIVVMMVWLGNVASVWERRKEKQLEMWLLPLYFLGGVVFHLFWEAKALYAFPYYVAVLPCAADGLDKLYSRLIVRRKGHE